jgi:hypothetical protein
MAIEKELAFQVAAILTDTVLEGVGALDLTKDYPFTVNADGTVTVKPSDLAKAKNWVVWETFRTFYWAVEQAAQDDKNWPMPVVSGQASVGQLAGSVTAVAGPLASVLGGPAGAAIVAALPGILAGIEALVKPSVPNVPSNVPVLPSVAAGS